MLWMALCVCIVHIMWFGLGRMVVEKNGVFTSVGRFASLGRWQGWWPVVVVVAMPGWSLMVQCRHRCRPSSLGLPFLLCSLRLLALGLLAPLSSLVAVDAWVAWLCHLDGSGMACGCLEVEAVVW